MEITDMNRLLAHGARNDHLDAARQKNTQMAEKIMNGSI